MIKDSNIAPIDRRTVIQNELAWHEEEAHRRYSLDAFLYDSPAFDEVTNSAIDFLQCASNQLVLDMGCGEGKETVELAAQHLCVISTDLSHTQLVRARQLLWEKQPNAQVHFVQANAEELPFAAGTFPIIYGKAILHHLDADLSVKEVKRLLKHQGRATFAEPLAHHPMIWLGRFLTPKLRTRDEHPMKLREMITFAQAFDTEEVDTYFLFAPCAYLLRALPYGEDVFRKLHRFLSRLDQQLFRTIKMTKQLAWYGVVKVQK